MDFFELQFEIVSTCNLQCVHCSSESIFKHGFEGIRYPRKNILELTQLMLKKSINGNVYFTGGEPLLCEDLSSLIASVRNLSRDVGIGLFSSGLVGSNHSDISPIDKNHAKLLKTAGLSDIYISVHSHKASKHDSFTAVKGSFLATMKSVEVFNDCGINTYFNVVLNSFNVNSLPHIIGLADEMKIAGLRFLKLVKHGRAVSNWDTIGLTNAQQEQALDKLIHSKNDFPQNISIAGFPHLTPCRPYPLARHCQAGKCFFYIDLFGSIYPCGCTKNKLDCYIAHLSDINIIDVLLDKSSNEIRNECYSAKEYSTGN